MLGQIGSSVGRWRDAFYTLLAVAVMAVMGASAQAQSTVTDIGVDAATLVTDSGTEVGTLLLAVIGLGIAVVLAVLAFRWIKRYMKG